MNNFNCEHCGEAILEGNDGRYITGCQHYPLKKKESPEKMNCGNCGYFDDKLNRCMIVLSSMREAVESIDLTKKEKPSEPQGWEREFKFNYPNGIATGFQNREDGSWEEVDVTESLKSFIRSLISEREKKAVEEYDKAIIECNCLKGVERLCVLKSKRKEYLDKLK